MRPFHLRRFFWWWSVGFSRRAVRGEYQSMRSALCASAPSHPFHAMPPRITRNSDRPRASDRTMVATQIPVRLPSFKTRLAWSPPDEESYRNGRQLRSKPLAQIERHSYSEVGWISRQNLLAPPVEGELFS